MEIIFVICIFYFRHYAKSLFFSAVNRMESLAIRIVIFYLNLAMV